MRLRTPFFFRFHNPFIPVATEAAEAVLAIKPDPDDLSIKVTVTGGSATMHALLAGYLYYDRVSAAIQMQITYLNSEGRPIPLHAEYSLLRMLNPQIMPLPARVSYEFPAAERELKGILESYLGIYRDDSDGMQPPAVDRYGRFLDFSSLDDLVEQITKHGAGVFLPGGAKLGVLAEGETLILRAKEFKNYSAIDQPLAIIDDSVPKGEPVLSGAVISGVYRGTGTDENMEPLVGETNYKGDLRKVGKQYKINHQIFRREIEVVVHFKKGGTDQKQRFPLDRFEKWALFDCSLVWHFKNWHRSGFLSEIQISHPFVLGLYADLYAPNAATDLTDYPGAGRTIKPPAPTILGYDEGEEQGIDRPIYDYDIRRLRWFLNRHDEDAFAAGALRDFKKFKYVGADGLEEYIKRVACSEFFFATNVTGKKDEDPAVKLTREREGFRAQIVAARTYVLFRWLSDSGLVNPIANNYAEIRFDETSDFHVHMLIGLNDAATKEKMRIVLEECAAEVYGLVVTYRGRMADAEYYAGDPSATQSCDDPKKGYIEPAFTKFGIHCGTSSSFGHGRGLSQNGSKTLSARSLTYLQILHWYYYGIQMRNNYGRGDVITRPPTSGNWLVSKSPPAVPQDLLRVMDERWRFDTAITETSAVNWYVSHDLRADEFSINADGVAAPLNVSVTLVEKLQELRYRTRSSLAILRIFLSPDGARVKSTHSSFQSLAREVFGDNVTPGPQPGEWNLML